MCCDHLAPLTSASREVCQSLSEIPTSLLLDLRLPAFRHSRRNRPDCSEGRASPVPRSRHAASPDQDALPRSSPRCRGRPAPVSSDVRSTGRVHPCGHLLLWNAPAQAVVVVMATIIAAKEAGKTGAATRRLVRCPKRVVHVDIDSTAPAVRLNTKAVPRPFWEIERVADVDKFLPNHSHTRSPSAAG